MPREYLRDYLSVDDLAPDELLGILDLSGKLKADPAAYRERMQGRSIALVMRSRRIGRSSRTR